MAAPAHVRPTTVAFLGSNRFIATFAHFPAAASPATSPDFSPALDNTNVEDFVARASGFLSTIANVNSTPSAKLPAFDPNLSILVPNF